MNQTNLSGRAYIAIGLMLFALFFGAGNLIFPASLGQHAGSNVWAAILGFIVTGVGLPLLGVLAMGYSGVKNVQELASRVHPIFGVLFTLALYLSIGPAFAIPRTGTVSYEIAVRPFLADGGSELAQTITLAVFFLATLWFSVSPAKLVNRIGKVLTPTLLVVILILIVKSIATPLGVYQAPTAEYATGLGAFAQGILDGYNTLDALASFVFGILVIEFITLAGAKTKAEITSATLKAGVIAVGCLGIVYIFIANLGATSVSQLGLLDTGAPVLASSAKLLFGNIGAVILACIVMLACLTTSIGLVTSCAQYFSTQFGGLSYKMYTVVFTVVSFFVGMFGLKTIISAAIPVLMALYPLTIVLILLTFMNGFFKGRRAVYAITMCFTLVASLVAGFTTAGVSLGAFGEAYAIYVPFVKIGMDWIPFAVLGFILSIIYSSVFKGEK